MRSPLLAASPLIAALAWTLALIVDAGPLTAASQLLVGVGLLAIATVAAIGLIVVGGRWALRLGLGTLACVGLVALIRPVDAYWVAAISITALSLVALLSPDITATVRHLPSASGPPPRAVIPPLILLASPVALGLTGTMARSWALLVVGLTAPVAALLYARVVPGGLFGIRLVWPLLALGLAPLLGPWAGLSAVVLAAAVAITAWGQEVKTAYHPPRQVGTTFPIPPELTPSEVREAARIDEKGRPI